MRLGDTEPLRLTATISGHARIEHDHTCAYIDDADRVLVAMRVDTNDVVQLICKHPH